MYLIKNGSPEKVSTLSTVVSPNTKKGLSPLYIVLIVLAILFICLLFWSFFVRKTIYKMR